jgi:hypothetical protein
MVTHSRLAFSGRARPDDQKGVRQFSPRNLK